MKVVLKYLFILIIPVSLFCSTHHFSSEKQSSLQSTLKKQADLSEVINLISLMSKTVHILQQERGASSGYVSSKAYKFGTKLENIKISSDTTVNALLKYINSNSIDLANYYTLKDKNNLNRLLNELSSLRRNVKNLKINFAKAYSKYTQIIAVLLLNITELSDKVKNKELSSKIYTYSLLLMYKESLGQKRAALSALFSQKKFSPEIYEYFLTSDTQEKIYLKSFLHSIDDKTKKNYMETFNAPIIKQVKEYEKFAIQKLNGKNIQVDPEKWFEYITIKINLVQKVEEQYFNNILALIKKLNNSSFIPLTEKEKKWISSHVVNVGVEQWNPLVFSNNGHDIDGITGDYLKLIIKKSGLRVNIINDEWSTLFKNFKDHKINILPATYYTKERAKIGHYSSGYFKMKDYIFIKKQNKEIRSLKDLNGKKLAIVKGYGTISKIKDKFPNIKLVLTKNIDDSINRVLNSEVDAMYEGQIVVEKKIANEMIRGLKGVAEDAFKAPSIYMYSQKDDLELHTILQKALDNISLEEKNEIQNKWLSNLEKKQNNIREKINLTKDEKEWLKHHRTIRFTGDPNWLPFEAFNNKGQYIGIVSEYLNKLEELTGIKFERITTKSWSESVKLSETKQVDVLSETTESNREHLIFTKPYITNDIIIVMKNNHPYAEGIAAIQNKTIALIKDYGYIEQIKQQFPDINFVTENTVNDGLSAVSTGKIDALICTFALGSYTITKMGISNIRIVGKTNFHTSLGLGIRNDYLPLVSILNKGIDSISKEEHHEIFNHWIKQNYVEKIDYSLLYKVGGSALILLLLFIFWNRKMAKEIGKREEAEAEMKASQVRLNTLFNSSPDSISIINKSGIYVDCNSATLELFGIATKEDFIGSTPDLYSPKRQESGIESSKLTQEKVEAVFREGTQHFEWTYKRVDTQKSFQAEVLLSAVVLDDEPYIYGIVRDITEKKLLQEQIKESQKLFTSMVSNVPGVIYRCLLDESWTMLFVNDEIEHLSGYPASDFLNNSVRTFTDIMYEEDIERVALYIQQQIDKKEAYKIDYRIRDKDGEIHWVRGEGKALYSDENKFEVLDGAIFDVTHEKIMEAKIKEEKEFTQTLLDSQEQIIVTTEGQELLTANEAFFDFFAVDSVIDFVEKYNTKCICDTFKIDSPEGYLQVKMENEFWIDYIISRPFENTYKAMIIREGKTFIFSVTGAKLPGNKGIKAAVFTNITDMENAKLEIEAIHKHTQESIEYASLIQAALIPDNKLLANNFKDYFTIWTPKDVVGGDVYLFEELRNKGECLLMVIDCTGHGVPGAFVTMLVKAIERQMIAKINYSNEIVSPAKILSIFNKNMKQLLKQENVDSISNAGFDGGILYYNKKENIIKYAGAETSLVYLERDELQIIKGNRYSVGYKKCDINYEYTEHTIEVKDGMQFYLTTDGYLDQNGGTKSFPFGKKRFHKLVQENKNKDMQEQKKIFLDTLLEYQDKEERNDDITFVGFKIG